MDQINVSKLLMEALLDHADVLSRILNEANLEDTLDREERICFEQRSEANLWRIAGLLCYDCVGSVTLGDEPGAALGEAIEKADIFDTEFKLLLQSVPNGGAVSDSDRMSHIKITASEVVESTRKFCMIVDEGRTEWQTQLAGAATRIDSIEKEF